MRSVFCLTVLLIVVGPAWFPASAAKPGPVMVVGDSLSAGYGLEASESWVALLGQRLNAQGYDRDVVNASVTGDTTRGGRARLARALERHAPGIVIIELGGNDGLRGIPIREMRSNLSAMIEAIHATGAAAVLVAMKIPPNYGVDYTRRFEETYAELGRAYGVPVAPFLLENVALSDGLMQDDGIHPNAQAQPLMLDTVWPTIAPLLAARVANQQSAGG